MHEKFIMGQNVSTKTKNKYFQDKDARRRRRNPTSQRKRSWIEDREGEFEKGGKKAKQRTRSAARAEGGLVDTVYGLKGLHNSGPKYRNEGAKKTLFKSFNREGRNGNKGSLEKDGDRKEGKRVKSHLITVSRRAGHGGLTFAWRECGLVWIHTAARGLGVAWENVIWDDGGGVMEILILYHFELWLVKKISVNCETGVISFCYPIHCDYHIM